jgi:hypothetical protein
MRRLVFPVIAALGLVMVGPSSAFADDPAPTVSVKATAGKKVCKVTDPKLDRLSGMVATSSGFIVINDGAAGDTGKKVFFLDRSCKIVDSKAYSGSGPRDTEDVVLSADGRTLWIADTGDNNFNKEDGTRRSSIGVWKMPVDGSKKPVLYRMTYPQGEYHDAEALLLTGATETPVIITKEIGKAAVLYEPTAALKANSTEGVPLKKVGTLTVPATETNGNPYARIGNKTIDGAAIAPGGGKVVVRTYTDALEWDVTGNDVLAAFKNKPRVTGLPNETLGESITYSADGKLFYTVSDMSGDHEASNSILQYTPSTTVAVEKKGSASGTARNAWYSNLTIDQITYGVGALGLIGLLLVGVGVMGIARHRKRVALLPQQPIDRSDHDPLDPETELIGVGGAPQRAGVYGGARTGPPGVYGGQPAGGAQRPGAYGGGAPQYARPQQGGQPPRGPQGQPRGPQAQPPGPQGQPPGRNGAYGPPGGQPGGGPQYGQPRGPQQGSSQPGGPRQGGPQQGGPQQGQRPQRPEAGQRPDGGQRRDGGQPPPGGQRPRSQGVYGQPGSGGGRPPQRGGDGYADRNGRPEGRFDNPGYRR